MVRLCHMSVMGLSCDYHVISVFVGARLSTVALDLYWMAQRSVIHTPCSSTIFFEVD